MEQSKRTLYILIAILVLAVAVRVTCVVLNGHNMLLGSLVAYDNDDVKYIRSGAVLLEHHRLVYRDPNEATAFIGPVLPAALAIVFSVFGSGMNGILAFQIFQALIGALSVLLIFLIGRDLFSQRVGMLAALIYAVEPTAVWNCGFILTETLFTFLLLLVTYFACRALKTKSVLHFVLLGLCWALASLLKSSIGLYFGVVLVAMLINKFDLKEVIRYSLVTCVAFVMLMSPWWIRNYAQFHRFIPFTASSGNPMIQGAFYNNKLEMNGLRNYTKSPTEIGQNDIDVMVAKERISRVFREDFWRYAYWFTIGKVIYLWKEPFYWTKGPITNTTCIIFLLYYITLALGIAGAVLGIRKDLKMMVLPVGAICYFTLIHLPFFVMSRYSFPVMTFVLLLACYRLVTFWERRAKTGAVKVEQPVGAG